LITVCCTEDSSWVNISYIIVVIIIIIIIIITIIILFSFCLFCLFSREAGHVMTWDVLVQRTGIGPLHDPVTWYGINYTGTQMAQWDFQNKGTRTSPALLSFVLKVPLRHLRPSVIYSVPCDRIVPRGYYVPFVIWNTRNFKPEDLSEYKAPAIFGGDKRQPEIRLRSQATLLPIVFCSPEEHSFARSLVRPLHLKRAVPNGKCEVSKFYLTTEIIKVITITLCNNKYQCEDRDRVHEK